MRQLKVLWQTKAELAITAAQHRCVDGKTNSFTARCYRALHHVFGKGPVALHIKLKPDWPLRVPCNLFYCCCSESADHKSRARCAGATRGGKFTLRVTQPVICHRRKQDRRF